MKKIWNYIEKYIHIVLTVIFRLLGKELTPKTYEAFLQFVKFCLVGITNTVVSYVLYACSLLLFRQFHLLPKADYLAAQAVAFVLSVLWSFFWNNRLVFTVADGKQRSVWKSLMRAYVSYSFTGLFLNSLLLLLWVNVFQISEFVAPIINLLVTVPVNYILNKFWAFR